jgi:ribosomal protein L37AE/L43A
MTTQNTNYSPPQIPAGRRSSHSPRHAPGARPVPCPYCGATSGVRHTGDTGRIQAWSCDHCATDFAFTVPDSRTAAALLGDLGAVAQEIRQLRWALAQVIHAGRRDAEANRRGVAYPVAAAN